MAPAQVQRWSTFHNGFDQMFRDAVPMPTPGRDEVLVEIHTVSLNYRDTQVITGDYHQEKAPEDPAAEALVPCSDMCGIVVAVGEGPQTVTWKVGDRVLSTFHQKHLTGQIRDLSSSLGMPQPGSLQTHRVFPTTGLVRTPEYLTDEEASCLPIAALTAWMAINHFQPIGQPRGKGDTVVLQGTGGVSVNGLQIAKAAGATTIVTSSSDAKLEKAKALGADHTINYRTTPDWQKTVMELTNSDGADIILECGGRETLQKSFGCIAFGGTIACIGYVSGQQDAPGDRTNVNLLALWRNVTLKGILVGPRDRFEEMNAFYEKHQIRPSVDRVFRFEEAKDAFHHLAEGKHFGKVVIRVAV